jgi:hypothetical protein
MAISSASGGYTSPGLVLVKTQTIGTSVSSVPVSDVFNAQFENYLITLNGGVGSTNQRINMVLTGSTTAYYRAGTEVNYANASSSAVNTSNGASWLDVGYSSTKNNVLNVNLFGPNLEKTTGMQAIVSPNIAGAPAGFFAGFHDVATAYTGFTISVSGTMTGGTIRVYGYRN